MIWQILLGQDPTYAYLLESDSRFVGRHGAAAVWWNVDFSPCGEMSDTSIRPTSRLVWAVRVLRKVAAIREMPTPQPSPTGEGAGCSRFRCCRPSEKECLKYQRQEFFRQPLSQGRWSKRRKRFFRRPLNPSVECVPQGTHAVG